MTLRIPANRCSNCVLDGGIDYSDPDDPRPCDHGKLAAEVGAAVARDQALAATGDAHPGALKAALKIIHDAARANPVVSSNTVRGLMNLADVPGPVRGRAWRQACEDPHKWVRAVDTEPSTQRETHAHHVRTYESLIYRGRVS